jgi:hypothetical protein
VVAKPLHADPLIHAIRPRRDGFRGKPFAAIVVCHRYWKNNLATVKALGIKKGGKFVKGIHFIAAGGATGSMLALMIYFGTGVIKDRYFGVKIPKANLQPSYLGESRAFVHELADSLGCAGQIETHVASPTSRPNKSSETAPIATSEH